MSEALKTGPVAIIGGGYAGLAAAVELATAGIAVHVHEASRSLGGRARRADTEQTQLDNGQHILIGAYRETLRLMRQVGADPTTLLQRLDLHLEYPGQLRIHAPDWPAPLHLAAALLGAQGLNWGEKWAALRFMHQLQRRRYRLDQDISVAALLRQLRQPDKLCRYLWEPLCIATLNTPARAASAQVFANVLRDSLGADKAASQLLLPKTDLSALFPEPAARYIESRGGQVLCGRRIVSLQQQADGWQLDDSDGSETRYSHVILATAPQHLSPLLAKLPELGALSARLAALRFEPIVTVYLQYPATVRLPQPMIGGFAEGDGLTQWLFDRGQLLDTPGLLAAVISADGPHQALDGAQLAAVIHDEITRLLPHIPALPAPLWHQVIREKRATFACTPHLDRLGTTTPQPGLLLAGDHIASADVSDHYPATIESAVRSGIAAAQVILRQ